MNLTAKTVAALVLPAGKNDAIHFDDAITGFGYRLRRKTSAAPVRRTWIAQYRRAGATRRVKLGDAGVLSAEAARAAAKKVLAAVALGGDPQRDRVDRRAKDAMTFSAVAGEYLQAREREVRPRTYTEVRRYLTGPSFRALQPMAIDTITRRDVASRLLVITREGGPGAARSARAAVHSLYVWAMQMGLVEANPVIGTPRPKANGGRSRVLTTAELVALWRACGEDEAGRIVRLLILSGCRRQEIGGLCWSELDRSAGSWTLPAARSKNHRAHTLPLPPAAWEIIAAVPQRATRDQLFGGRGALGFTSWAEAKRQLEGRLGDTVAPFVFHDIRRSVATHLADLGVQPHVIEQILNHQSGHRAGPAGIYNRSSYDREVRAALAMWADHVRALVEGGERKIINMMSPVAS